MYELNQVSENCFYIQSPAKVGLVKLSDKDVCLIDSGSDKDAGRRIKQILEQNNWNLKAIYNTHSNADHIGGNRYLQTQTGCKIYIPSVEESFAKYPILEPSFLYGGFPFRDLKHKFIMAQESDVQILTPANLPQGLKTIELKGHFFNMAGYMHKDRVVYLADCLFSKDILDKYKIPFIYDVENYLKTLEKVKEIEAKIFVPSHAPITDDIRELAQYNIDSVKNTAEKIIKILKTAQDFETLLQIIFNENKITMTKEQYILVGSTIKSYLSWLYDGGKIEYYIEQNKMYWKSN